MAISVCNVVNDIDVPVLSNIQVFYSFSIFIFLSEGWQETHYERKNHETPPFSFSFRKSPNLDKILSGLEKACE